jgi:hypothetical protein
MRRGLMAWNEAEISLAALDARAERLRAAMREDGLDGFLIYTNFPRPSAVAWLTSFTPYWSEAILYVPAEGDIVFATALSKRVGQWARSVNPVGEIAHTPRPGAEISRRIAAAGARRIGVLEFDLFPNGLYEDCEKAATAATFVDGSAAFSRARAIIDEVAAAEEKVRLGGAEEVYVAIAPDLDRDRRFVRLSGTAPLGRRFALRVSAAYKGSWVRRIATFACDEEGRNVAAQAAAWFDKPTARLDDRSPLAAQIAEAVASLPDATVTRWSAESCFGSYPLEAIAGAGTSKQRETEAGSLVVLSLDLVVAGVPWSGGAPIILGEGAR